MAMSTRKPLPLFSAPERKRCAICGSPSYSASGIHPQCAAKRAGDLIRAADKACADEPVPKPPRQQWALKWAR